MSTRTFQLRPCPFCGGKAKLEKMGWPHHVYCLSCGVKMTSHDFDIDGEVDVCTKWNRRTIDKPIYTGIDAATALRIAWGGDSNEKHSGE